MIIKPPGSDEEDFWFALGVLVSLAAALWVTLELQPFSWVSKLFKILIGEIWNSS